AHDDSGRKTVVAKILKAADGEDTQPRGKGVADHVGAGDTDVGRNITAKVGVEGAKIEPGVAEARLVDLGRRENVRLAQHDLVDGLGGESGNAGTVAHRGRRQSARFHQIIAAETISRESSISSRKDVVHLDVNAVCGGAANRVVEEVVGEAGL